MKTNLEKNQHKMSPNRLITTLMSLAILCECLQLCNSVTNYTFSWATTFCHIRPSFDRIATRNILHHWLHVCDMKSRDSSCVFLFRLRYKIGSGESSYLFHFHRSCDCSIRMTKIKWLHNKHKIVYDKERTKWTCRRKSVSVMKMKSMIELMIFSSLFFFFLKKRISNNRINFFVFQMLSLFFRIERKMCWFFQRKQKRAIHFYNCFVAHHAIHAAFFSPAHLTWTLDITIANWTSNEM